MAYTQADKDALRRAYVFDALPLEKAAQMVGVSTPTACRWKAQAKKIGDDWDLVKSARTVADGSLEELARGLLTEIVILFKTATDAVKADDLDAKEKVQLLTMLSDSYTKAIGANKKLMPTTDKLAVAMQVIELLGDFIKDNKPNLMQDFVDVLVPFGAMVEKEFNG